MPNVFIVGAPKCGTTSLARWLGDHPEAYVPTNKELNFFGADLAYRRRATAEEYRLHFEAEGLARVRCDASVYYLASAVACEEIARVIPDPRAIVCVRHPVDLMAALHSHHRRHGIEPLETLAAALAAEPSRLLRPVSAAQHPHAFQYRHIARLGPQIQRARSVLGAERVMTVVLDDMAVAPAQVYRTMCAFVGLDPDESVNLEAYNQNVLPRSTVLHRIATKPLSPRIKRSQLRSALLGAQRALYRVNVRREPRGPLDPRFVDAIAPEVNEWIEELANVLSRDLSPWTITDGAFGGLTPDPRWTGVTR